MTEESKKTAKKAPAKTVAEAKAPKVAPAAGAKPAKKTPAKKAAPSGATIRIVQTGSKIGRRADQEATLIGLGLNKRHKSRELQDTPEIRGMINKVRHLVKVEGA